MFVPFGAEVAGRLCRKYQGRVASNYVSYRLNYKYDVIDNDQFCYKRAFEATAVNVKEYKLT